MIELVTAVCAIGAVECVQFYRWPDKFQDTSACSEFVASPVLAAADERLKIRVVIGGGDIGSSPGLDGLNQFNLIHHCVLEGEIKTFPPMGNWWRFGPSE